MRYILLILILFFFNSCNLENGVNKNYIISQAKDTEADSENESQN